MGDELIHKDIGTSLTSVEFHAVGAHVFNSQAQGDILYASSATQLTRLGAGTAGNALISGGAAANPSWFTGLTFANDGTKTTVLGLSGDYTRFGDANITQASLSSEDDVMVTGKLEVLANVYLVSGGTGSVYINETANTKSTLGITINMGANDDDIFTCKSSDVSCPWTTEVELDTFFRLRKISAAQGGAYLGGYRATATRAFMFAGVGVADVTTKTTSSDSYFRIEAAKGDGGTSWGACGADANLCIVANAGTNRFIFDAEGTLHLITGDNDLDLLALSATTGTPKLSWDESEDIFVSSHGWDLGAACEANAYTVGGVAGADFGPADATSFTVVKGIITAIS